MKRRLKIKAKELSDAKVDFISLVDSPANRLPFRVLKRDKTDDTPEGPLMRLGDKLFGRSSKSDDVKHAYPDVVGVAVRKGTEDRYVLPLGNAGFDVTNATERGDDFTMYMQKQDAEAGVVMHLNDDVCVVFENTAGVQKMFDPYTESTSFAENLRSAGYMPGIMLATDALMDTFGKILMATGSADETRNMLRKALREYQAHVLELTDKLPTEVFKAEAMTVEVETEETAVTENHEAATPEADDVVASDGQIEKADEAVEGKAEKADVPMTPEEIQNAPVEEIETPDDHVEPETPDLATIVKDALAPIADAVTALTEKVDGVIAKQEEVESELKDVAQKASETERAVKGTVVSNADTDGGGDGSAPVSKSDVPEDERVWKGTQLDRLV